MMWTKPNEEKLRRLWEDGATARQIATELGDGCTRNAVIGKAHRLQLSERPSPIQRKADEKPITAEEKMDESHDISTLFVPLMPATKHRHRGRGVALVDLGPRSCRFPLGDPQDKDFGFCGGEAAIDKAYCAQHISVCYVSDSQYRKAKVRA